MNIKGFHDHLDVCTKCANKPFDLCAVGEQLIKEAAGHPPGGHCLHPPKCIGKGPSDERDPLGCCNCGTREAEKRLVEKEEMVPHFYVETNPYKGCAMCGVGPGAFFHNEYEVKRFLEEALGPTSTSLRTKPEDE